MAGVVFTIAAICILLLVKELKSAILMGSELGDDEKKGQRKLLRSKERRARPALVPVVPVAAATFGPAAPPVAYVAEMAEIPDREPVFYAVFSVESVGESIAPQETISNDRMETDLVPLSRNFCSDRIASILASFDEEETDEKETVAKPFSPFVKAPETPISGVLDGEAESTEVPVESAPVESMEESLELVESDEENSPAPAEAQLMPQRPPAPVAHPHPLEIFRPDETRMALGLRPFSDREFSCENRKRGGFGKAAACAASPLQEHAKAPAKRKRTTTRIPKNPKDSLLAAD